MKDIDQSLPAMSASSSKSISDSQCISCHGAINPAALPKAPTASICKLHCLFRRICHQRHHYRSCRIHHEASTAVQQENQCRTSCRSSRNCRLWKATNYSVRNERPTASTDSDPISETYKNVANHPHLDTVCHSACLSNMSDTHLCRDKQNLNSVSIQDKEENNTINESIDVTIYVKKPVRDDRYSVSATANDVKDPAQDNKGSPILSTLSPLQRYHKKTHRAGQNMRKTFLPYRQSLQLGAFFGFHPVTQSALTPYLAQH
ncbi:hypothetical protein KP509_01G039300 [Ceratopteris richardii]|nr:hypothetical protein KP509_01G039300 [Ceratopteris richardii]